MDLNDCNSFGDIWDLVDSLENDESLVSSADDELVENGNKCDNCGENNFEINTSDGMVICTSCGFVNSELLDKNINNFNDKTNNNYGCPTNYFLPKSSLGTKVKNGKYTTLAILEKWSQMPYKERSLLEVLKYIELNCKKSNIPVPIIENSKIIFKKVSDLKNKKFSNNKFKNIIIRGLNRKSIIAACVFHGALLQKQPRSPKEISEIFNIEEKQVTKGCRKLRDLLPFDNILSYIKSSQTISFIRDEYAEKLNISKQHLEISKRITLNIKKIGIATDHQPPSVAAGSLLLLSNIFDLKISKKLISKLFKISQVTIMKTYKKIFPYRKIIISNDNTDKYLKIINGEEKKCKNLINEETDSETIDSINSEEYKDDSLDYIQGNKNKNLISRYL